MVVASIIREMSVIHGAGEARKSLWITLLRNSRSKTAIPIAERTVFPPRSVWTGKSITGQALFSVLPSAIQTIIASREAGRRRRMTDTYPSTGKKHLTDKKQRTFPQMVRWRSTGSLPGKAGISRWLSIMTWRIIIQTAIPFPGLLTLSTATVSKYRING